MFKASPGKYFGDPISKITKAKWSGGVAQAEQGMLCKHEALSSAPVPSKKPCLIYKIQFSTRSITIIPVFHN
jgi:hypothetical protein